MRPREALKPEASIRDRKVEQKPQCICTCSQAYTSHVNSLLLTLLNHSLGAVDTVFKVWIKQLNVTKPRWLLSIFQPPPIF